jgi:TnpA family transposase
MSSPNDRRLYAFEAKGRYGVLAPFMGEHLDRKLIEANWDDVQRVITAFRNRVVAPSLILRKLGTTRAKARCRSPCGRSGASSALSIIWIGSRTRACARTRPTC